MKERNYPQITALLEEIGDLQQAQGLLEDIWLEINPYNPQPLSQELLRKLRQYFHFDDSE